MSSSCREPLSFLTLERFALGELTGDAKARVEEHLATCAVCKSELAAIEKDNTRPLRPLPAKKAKVVVRPWFARPQVMALAGLAAAAAIVLIVNRTPPRPKTEDDDRIKGSTEVGFTLVREDDVVLPEAGGPYRDGERFKALVTCPPGLRGSFDLVVLEDNAPPSFPLAPAINLPCGNAVPLPGAFRATGHAPMKVCLVWQDSGGGAVFDRTSAHAGLPPNAQCKLLDPAK